jgi:hypothetical protein
MNNSTASGESVKNRVRFKKVSRFQVLAFTKQDASAAAGVMAPLVAGDQNPGSNND